MLKAMSIIVKEQMIGASTGPTQDTGMRKRNCGSFSYLFYKNMRGGKRTKGKSNPLG
jgi:hypothetical protein